MFALGDVARGGWHPTACERKQRHLTYRDALAHLLHLQFKFSKRETRLVVYRCWQCHGGWHVGHRPGLSSRTR